MKKRTALNYIQKIEALLPSNIFKLIEKDLLKIQEKYLEAFWNIISAGYTIDFALNNCKSIFCYKNKNQISYTDTLVTLYSVYPGLIAGVEAKIPDWFELN